jgi:cytochrome c556
MTSTSETQAAIEEIRKTRDTAARLANGDYTEDADHVRVLAGMIQKLAEQMERLAPNGQAASHTTGSGRSGQGDSQIEDAVVEEDRTPQDAPADPLNDRT